MSKNVEFQYNWLQGESWASGHLCIGSSKFEFVCSYILGDPLEQLLHAVYQIVPGLAPFPRKKIDFVMLEEPVEYIWEFEWITQQNLSVTIREKGSELKMGVVYRELCHIEDLLKALVHGINKNAVLRSNENIEKVYQQFTIYLKTA
ncbi:hypothetical protein [Planococcus dechangensis]|uniref:YbjN domain-containing protein n=1 Tax=Planococcus dechangensis TaxID=1176255 RepID=A0ABV9MA56_9BACL